MENDLTQVLARMLKDVQVELKDEFDQNFARQAFFTEKWARRRSPLRPGRATLVDTGGLRRSIMSKITHDGVTFYSARRPPHTAAQQRGRLLEIHGLDEGGQHHQDTSAAVPRRGARSGKGCNGNH